MSEYDELVKAARGWYAGNSDDSQRMVWLLNKQADAIEALVGEVATLTKDREILTLDLIDRAKEIDALKAALQPFAAIKADDGDTFDTWQDDVIIRCEVTVRDLKQARAALTGTAPRQVTLVMTVGENETTYVFSSFWAAQAWVAKHPQPHIITTRVVDHPEIVTEPMQ